MKFTTYDTVFGTSPTGIISTDQLVSVIKTHPKRNEILAIRAKNLSKTELNNIKRQWPIITPHAILGEGQRATDKVIQMTGLLFVDIDPKNGAIEIPEIKNKLIERPEIFAAWVSFSGKGVHALAAVNGVTLQNYKELHEAYLDKLGEEIKTTCDKNVINLPIGLVISTDEEIVYKNDYSPIDLPIPVKSGQDYSLRERREKATAVARFYDGLFRYKISLDSYPQPVVHIPEGKDYYECFIPVGKGGVRRIHEGSRNKTLAACANNLILLNPQADFDLIMSKMNILNNYYCFPSLPDAELYTIVKNKWNSRSELIPIGLRKKYFWIDPTVHDKLKAYFAFRKNMSEEKIQGFFDVLQELGMKVTTRLIAEISEVGERTVKRYLTPEQKQVIEQHNKKYIKRRTK